MCFRAVVASAQRAHILLGCGSGGERHQMVLIATVGWSTTTRSGAGREPDAQMVPERGGWAVPVSADIQDMAGGRISQHPLPRRVLLGGQLQGTLCG
jgi:hypothetical protein